MDESFRTRLHSLGEAFAARYRPGEILGAGASGLVFRARQLELDRDVVVKVVDFGADPDPVAATRFKKEAAILARIQHPRVIRILEFGAIGRLAYLTYPDDRGVPLTAWLETRGLAVGRTPLALPRVRDLLVQLLEGLRAVHAAGVVHRDLKPTNLLILPDETLRIIDFGLAGSLANETRVTKTGSILGTPRYMAPDQIRGLVPDPRDDLYAAGVIAYELTTGTSPFSGLAIHEVLSKQLAFDPPSAREVRPEVPVEFSVLLADLMAKPRNERPTGAAEALDRLLRPSRPVPRPAAGASGSHPPVPAGPVPARSAWRAAGLAALLVLGLWAASRGPARGPAEADPEPGPSPAGEPGPRPGPARPQAPGGPTLASVAAARAELEAALAEDRRQPSGPTRALPPEDLRDLRTVFEARLPATMAIPAWIARGGRTEALAEEVREALAELDSALAEHDIPSPLDPFLRTLPSGKAVAPDPEPRIPSPEPVEGWLARAMLRARVADRELVRHQAEIQGIGGTGAMGSVPDPIWAMGGIFMATESGRKPELQWLRLKLYGQTAPLRREVADWLAEGSRATRETVYAGFRSMADEPGTRQQAFRFTTAAMMRLVPLVSAPQDLLDPSPLLYLAETSPEAGLAALLWIPPLMDLAADGSPARRDMVERYFGFLTPPFLRYWFARQGGPGGDCFNLIMGFVRQAGRYDMVEPLFEAARADPLAARRDRQHSLAFALGVAFEASNPETSTRSAARTATRDRIEADLAARWPDTLSVFRSIAYR